MKSELRTLIQETKGKFFTITFIKKDGTTRTINGKDKYLRLLSNGGSPQAGMNSVKKAGFESFVNRNRENWACAKDENLVMFKCGKLEKHFSV